MKRILFGIVSIIGIILAAAAAIVGWAILPNYINNQIEKAVQLVNGSDTWKKWSNITVPIQMKIYIFHVKNPDEVEQNGEFPKFQEFGPYIYDQIRIKEDLAEKDGSVFYRQKTIFKFNTAESIGPVSDKYNVINVAYVSVLNGISKLFPFLIPGVSEYLQEAGQKIILRGVSIKDLMFEGYDVQAFKDHPLVGSRLPKEYDGGRFGLYKGKNNTDGGYYQINSGVRSSSTFGEIVEWEKKTTLGYWGTENLTHCDMINGTDGSIFPPFVEKDRILRVFISGMCRSVYLTYYGEAEIHGVSGYKFTIPKEMLQDPRINEDNRCFCVKEDISECEHSGVLDLGPCRGGAPIVMSMPYFLGGSSVYQEESGLIPNNDLHETALILEPNSGVLLSARKRLQLNVKLRRYDSTHFENVTKMIFPVLWVDESADISPQGAQNLQDKFLTSLKTINTARWTVLVIGIILTVGGALLFFANK